ncbi:hypothetical protein Skr01_28720 [Sphaerisporangium krabiense]|uniref:DUF3592 domain-containing protein n=1 Tax=Sphaerisporangium krabiense TaxID=763782 RepID=A0A7W9DSZ7_9ACTN|nr:hypothetical protein [Sphaerisporangium krabiense]MBB5630262.1 hypothetical protein [Sphaerisporangium krabiense]GII62787.1 hypothetical protein Skr01_28720 [Sphaerisporangium krabiense]
MTSGRRRRSPFLTIVLTFIGALLLYLAVPSIGPTLRAARAEGTPGEFTARQLYCIQHPGHESCTWLGDFRTKSGEIRTDIALYGSDRTTLRAGESTRAIDVGRPNQVYGPGGSNEWIFTGLLLLAGLAILVFLYLPRSRGPARGRPAEEAAAGV